MYVGHDVVIVITGISEIDLKNLYWEKDIYVYILQYWSEQITDLQWFY